MEDERSESCKVQQVRRADDASQSLQVLWILQQKRNYRNGLIKADERVSEDHREPFFDGFFYVRRVCNLKICRFADNEFRI